MQQLSLDDVALIGLTSVFVSMLFALPVAMMLTLVLNRLFRKRVERSMQAAAGVSEKDEPTERSAASRSAEGGLEMRNISATREQASRARALTLVAAARRCEWQLAEIFSGAACAHPLVLAAIMIASTYTPQVGYPVLQLASLYGWFFLPNGTPVVLAWIPMR